jgi:succinoglycan biosynthesis protein ExoW
MRFTCVIPYFQREPGILRRALDSVAKQVLVAGDTIDICIVDDASPEPAGPEVEALEMVPHIKSVKIIYQENGGPGDARNTGIVYARRNDADAIAFLDSDDEWMPLHLWTAHQALDIGADFFFADHLEGEEGTDVSWFESLGAKPPTQRVFGITRRHVSAGITYEMLTPVAAFARTFLAQPSTVVVGKRLFEVTYDKTLQAAVEDYPYTFECAFKARRVFFSPRLGCVKGKGVNVYRSTFTERGLPYLRVLRDSLIAAIKMRNLIGDNNDQGIMMSLDDLIRRRERAYLRFRLSMLAKGKLNCGEGRPLRPYRPLLWAKAPLALLPEKAS